MLVVKNISGKAIPRGAVVNLDQVKIQKGKRRDKLVALQNLVNLETGELYHDEFTYENDLYAKAIKMKSLAYRIMWCGKCPGLNYKKLTESAPGWGNLNADIFFIGQSLHEPGVSSGIPFIIGCGYYIDAALRLSGLLRKDVFMTNVLHCHPPQNRQSSEEEKFRCFDFLVKEISIVRPKLIVAMGNDAKEALQKMEEVTFDGTFADVIENTKVYKIRHPAAFLHSSTEDIADWIVKLSEKMDRFL